MNTVTNDDAFAEAMPVEERRRTRRWMSLAAAGAVASAAMLAAPQLATAAPHAPPDVPSTLLPPAGNVLSDVGRARGFQIYTCQSQGAGYAWVLLQPMAVLLQEGHKPFALHYGGPSWTAMDGSTVVATRAADPVPASNTIPWLLLRATSNTGPAGGTFTSTTYIQRLNTTGGVAPPTGCDAGHVGAQAPVAYTADYYFYRAG
jgi:hypothetical protein